MKQVLFITMLFATAACFSAELETRSWDVDGLQREALVHIPEGDKPIPLVFVFHGHGGTRGE